MESCGVREIADHCDRRHKCQADSSWLQSRPHRPRSESDGRAHGRTCRSAHPGRRPWPLVRGCFDGISSLHRRDTARTLRAQSGPPRPLRGDRRGRIGRLCRPARCAHCWAHGKLRQRGKSRILSSILWRGADSPGCWCGILGSSKSRGRWLRAWRNQSRCFSRCPTSCLPGRGRPGNFRPASAVAVTLPVPGRVRVQGSRVEQYWPTELRPERQDRIVVSQESYFESFPASPDSKVRKRTSSRAILKALRRKFCDSRHGCLLVMQAED